MTIAEEHGKPASLSPFLIENINWPSADRVLEALRKRKPGTFIHGVSGSAKAFLISWLFQKLKEEHPWLILTPSQEDAVMLYGDLSTLTPSTPIFLCPSWETLPGDPETPDPELIGDRQRAFYQLMQGGSFIVVASLIGALQHTLPAEEWLDQVLVLRKGQDAPLDLKDRLVALGYEPVNQVVQLGQFAMRGGILDIASPGSPSGPVRLEFFGETLDSVRSLNLFSQRSGGDLSEILIFPAHEVVLSPKTQQNLKAVLRSKAKDENGVPSHNAETALELLGQTRQFPGWEWQTIGALAKRQCLLDYIPEGTRILIEEPMAVERKFSDLQDKLMECGKRALEEKFDLFDTSTFFSDLSFLNKSLKKGMAAGLGQIRQEFLGDAPEESLAVETRTLPPYNGKFPTFASDLKKWLASGTHAVLWCHNKGERERFSELLREQSIETKENPKLSLLLGEVEQGFAIDEIGLAALPDHVVFRRYRGNRRRTRVRAVAGGKPLASLNELSVGDWTVHVDCGICFYRGLTPLTIDGVTREYIQLEFADNEKIYLPTDQIGLIQRYIGSEGSPALSKLGGEQWSRVKARVRQEIEAVARELMALYSTRQVLRKKPFSSDAPWQMEFEDSFIYELTPGQHQAIQDVKRDMQSEQVMDRLVCGDVGYGKTEVAMRAAFKAVLDKRQVAVLVPTTILAQQHYHTFKERMAEYPVEIHMLSRFRSKSEIERTLELLREGKVDILIGTHKLIMKDVRFSNLGLLIIDEEHRFGVSQKERLKSLKRDVDVLTLTATPIPRTLHMSLSGIREISIIDTPPQNRLSVLTQVAPMDDRLVAEAVRRELNREGQVFYVHNHVKDIDRIADSLQKTVPEARLAVAHGQLAKHELESVMIDFVDKEYDVLVCTSIIESGLDMPNVNTLIVERADHFGLAQMYQLKGRVGRTDRQAYAYFFYPRYITLRELAQKRLEVLQQFSTLGSGLHIAMKDMEIRGAGNVLGTQQHGNMDSIGFDLYSRMLGREMARMKGQEAEEDFVPALSLGVSAYFPKEYISEEAAKIDFYRRLAEMSEEKEVTEIGAELEDRFGPLPAEARMLLTIASFRPRVKRMGIQRLEALEGWVSLQWREDRAPSQERVDKWFKTWPPSRIRFSSKEPHSVSFRVMKGDEDQEARLLAVDKLLKNLGGE